MAFEKAVVYLALFLGLTALCHCQVYTDTTCDKAISGSRCFTRHYINNTCSQGVIDWHSPSGKLFLYYNKGNTYSQFQFCLHKGWVVQHETLVDLTDVRYATIPMPTEGHPSCITSSRGEISVRVSARADAAFVTSLRFSVRSL